jgi:peroxiredoxin
MLWRPPAGLIQPLRAIPEADLGPFPVAPAAFRFRLANRSALPTPAVGQSAPGFALPAAGSDTPVRLTSLRGRSLVLCFFCGCGDCQAAARRLAPEARVLGARIVAVVENERQLLPERIARFRRVTGFDGLLLADRGGAVTRRYRSQACPQVWVLDHDGVIRYRTAGRKVSPVDMTRRVRETLAGAVADPHS